jgi:hypothetical protein
MTWLVLGGFVALVLTLTWLARRRGQRLDGCCAPANPRRDLRMRAAFNDEPPPTSGETLP